MSLAVRMAGVSKRYPGPVQALDAVDFEVEIGSIVALVGENGAGKTTLMRVLYGAERPDAGTVELNGSARALRSARDGIAAGIGIVSQHTGIVPELTCLENLVVGPSDGSWLDRRALESRASELAERLGVEYDWNSMAAGLSPAGAQKLEILKLLWRSAKILILDEPTAMLSPADSDALFGILRNLAADGSTAIVVTHRLPEVMAHCTRATVLRAGRKVAEFEVAQSSADEIARAVVGDSAVGLHMFEPKLAVGPTAIAISNLSLSARSGRRALHGIDLEVAAGEVLGIAGVDGNGQSELVRCLLGSEKPDSGSIRLFGEPIGKLDVAERIRLGLRAIPEDRQVEGSVADWPVEDNAALGFQRELRRGPAIDVAQRRSHALAVVERFGAKTAGLGAPFRTLSGGNQQRIVAARALARSPRLIVAFQPARGLDIAGSAQVYAAIREACEAGAAAIVVAFDLDELLERADRIVAMFGGKLLLPPAGLERDREAIGRLMVGAA